MLAPYIADPTPAQTTTISRLESSGWEFDRWMDDVSCTEDGYPGIAILVQSPNGGHNSIYVERDGSTH